MTRTRAAIAAAALALTAIAGPTASATVPTGNGTSNFYGTGKCGVAFGLGTWAELNFTNYDYGKNQIVHTHIRRSGIGVQFRIYINGVFIESGDTEDYYKVNGHSRVVVGMRASALSPWYTCSAAYTR